MKLYLFAINMCLCGATLILYFSDDYKNYKIMRNISIFYWIILIVMKILHLF